MNIRDFSINPASLPDRIEGIGRIKITYGDDDASEEAGKTNDADSGWTEMPIRLRTPVPADAFYDDWVSAFIKRQTIEIVPPIAPFPPERFDHYLSAESCAKAARLKLFHDHYPAELTTLLRRQAVWPDGGAMDKAVAAWDEKRRTPTAINDLRLYLACLWTSHYLWLMSDEHGSWYFERKVLPLIHDLRTSTDAYKRARWELGLKPHSGHPVSGITPDGGLNFVPGKF